VFYGGEPWDRKGAKTARENHGECLDKIRKGIDAASEAGFPNVICFSGNRAGMDDVEGMKNCEIAVKAGGGIGGEEKCYDLHGTFELQAGP